jgi:hypothetical protein
VYEREQLEYRREQGEHEYNQMLDSGIGMPSSFEIQGSTSGKASGKMPSSFEIQSAPILNTTGQAAMPGGLGPIGKVRERAAEFRGGVPGGLGRGSLEFFPPVGLS